MKQVNSKTGNDAVKSVNLIVTGIVIMSLLAGAGITLYGFAELTSGSEYDGSWRWGYRYISLLFWLSLVIGVFALWRGYRPLFVTAVLALIIALVGGKLVPVFVVATMALSAYALGRMLFSQASVTAIDCLLIGLVLFGTLLGISAHFQVGYVGVYSALFALPLLAGWRHASKLLRYAMATKCEGVVANWNEQLISSVLGAVILLHFMVSLMPIVGHDALAMHLFVPAQIASSGMWGFDVGLYSYAVMPMLVNWLYSAAYMFADEVGARLVNFGGFILLAKLVYNVALWARASRVAALFGVLVFVTTPLALTQTSSLFVDSIWSALIVSGTLALLRLRSQGNNTTVDILIAAILLAGGLSAKAASLTVLPVLAIFVVIGYRRWYTSFKPALVGLIVFFLIGAVPYLTAFVITGNPVFPFFNAIFQSPLYRIEDFQPPKIFEVGFAWDTLYQMTFNSDKYLEGTPGASGFQWLMLVLPACMAVMLTRNWRAILLIFIAGGAMLLTFEQTAYLRYIFPSVAIACSVAAIGLTALHTVGGWPWLAGLFAACVVVFLNMLHFEAGTWYGKIDFQVIAKPSQREIYIQNVVPIRKTVAKINELNLNRTPVAFFSAPLAGDLKSDALFVNWYNQAFQDEMLSAQSPDEAGRLLARRDVEYMIVDDFWGHPELLEMVRESSLELSRVGSVSVRRLLDTHRFSEELLKAPDFQSGRGWHFAEGAVLDAGRGAVVNVASPAFAVVRVDEGKIYRYSAVAMCHDKPTKGRLQVNWHDRDGGFVKTDIQVFDCKPEALTHSIDLRAPRGADHAIVYASGHTQKSIVFSSISFRK